MWNASSTEILASQTCWKASGYNGCRRGRPGTGQGKGKKHDYEIDRINKRAREDEEIMEFVTVLLTKGIL